MHKKSLTFGIGVGVLAMVAVMYLVYWVQNTKTIGSYEAALKNAREQTVTVTLTDEEIVTKARSLGMVYPAEIAPAATPDDVLADDNVLTPATATGIDVAGAKSAPEAPEDLRIDLNIPDGLYASEIALILKENGVIDDAAAFSKYMMSKGYSKKIQTGVFNLPLNGNYQEVADRITGKKR